MLIVVLSAAAVCAGTVVFAVGRCRRASRLIDRILAEEIGRDPEPADEPLRDRAGITRV